METAEQMPVLAIKIDSDLDSNDLSIIQFTEILTNIQSNLNIFMNKISKF